MKRLLFLAACAMLTGALTGCANGPIGSRLFGRQTAACVTLPSCDACSTCDGMVTSGDVFLGSPPVLPSP